MCAGAVLRNDVVGRIMMKCLLSDMPELRLGLNEKIEDITFHQVNRGEGGRAFFRVPQRDGFRVLLGFKRGAVAAGWQRLSTGLVLRLPWDFAAWAFAAGRGPSAHNAEAAHD